MNFFVILLACVSCVYGSSKLLSVVVVYRHGFRTPTEFASTDKYKDKETYWSDEPGELINRGKQEHYALGQWLRSRYQDFLPAKYNKNDIYVRSSQTDRCLMSAAANLAGLYPPKGDQIWNADLHWMPIPIHTVPTKEDNLLKMGKVCPNFQPKFEELLNSDNFTAIDKANTELYEYLSESLGEKIKRFSDIEPFYDTMTIEDEYEMKRPNWTNKILKDGTRVYPDAMKKWADLAFAIPTYTPELARLGTGRFFDTLASHFEAVVKNDTKNKLADKMVMFSAHKSTVCDLTHTLGVFRVTPYAGALIFELRRNPDTQKNYVNTIFKSSDIERLEICGSDFDCDFNKFLEILKPYRLNEKQWKAECLSGAASAAVVSIKTFSSLTVFLVLYVLS
ncbi:hypothetical protein HHI36_021161 [Cryptolaemus montrouzieri]|uniref:acid phosphatase n=1 Tax=Cryptolaemus montrouzieri TaxID=559131 RepID=A0ABD2MX06_9CUCU